MVTVFCVMPNRCSAPKRSFHATLGEYFWGLEGRASATGSLVLSIQLLRREIRVLLHVRASLLGQRLILTQDARRLRRH